MDTVKLRQNRNIFYRDPNGDVEISQREGDSYRAYKNEKIILYALDDGTFTKLCLVPNSGNYKFSKEYGCYYPNVKGTVKIFGHYPLFYGEETVYGQRATITVRTFPVYMDIDGRFYKTPVVDFIKRLSEKR